MNAGIFEIDGTPTGLHVENGVLMNPLNLKSGEGNFFFKPNGVFFIGADEKAGILESAEYAARAQKPKLALQSGPLLLVDGAVNPKFSPGSANRKHRNGIGLDRNGHVVFAITVKSDEGQRRQANLFEFASLFIKLDCRDALFLDGDVSALFLDPKTPIEHKGKFGAILAATEPEPDASGADPSNTAQ